MPATAVTVVEDIPPESPRVSGIDGLLHGAHTEGSRAVRVRAPVPPSPSYRASDHHATSHGGVVRTASGRRLSGRHCTALDPPRSCRAYGAAFQRRVAAMGIAEVVSAPASPWQNPYVERVIGYHPPGVPGSRRGLARCAPTTRAPVLSSVLPPEPHASRTAERHARSPADRCGIRWTDHRHP